MPSRRPDYRARMGTPRGSRMKPHAVENDEGFHRADCEYCAGILDFMDLVQLKWEFTAEKDLPKGFKIIKNEPFVSVFTLAKLIDSLIS